MAKTKAKSAIPNWKKKKWYTIIAPASFSEKILGESLCEEPNSLIGKSITANMMNVTDNPRKQNFNMTFRVVQVKDGKGVTKPVSISMIPSYTRRLIKSGRDRLDMSFTAKTSDGIVLRLKPLLVTQDVISRKVSADIQVKAKESLEAFVEKNTSDAVFNEIAKSNLQKDLKKVLDKVFPMRLVEIRVVEVELQKGERLLGEVSETVTEASKEPSPVAEKKVEETSSEEAEEDSSEEETPKVTKKTAKKATKKTTKKKTKTADA